MLIRMATDGEVDRASRGRYGLCDSVDEGVTTGVTMGTPQSGHCDGKSSTPRHKRHKSHKRRKR